MQTGQIHNRITELLRLEGTSGEHLVQPLKAASGGAFAQDLTWRDFEYSQIVRQILRFPSQIIKWQKNLTLDRWS